MRADALRAGVRHRRSTTNAGTEATTARANQLEDVVTSATIAMVESASAQPATSVALTAFVSMP
jgi:hypothetical protein